MSRGLTWPKAVITVILLISLSACCQCGTICDWPDVEPQTPTLVVVPNISDLHVEEGKSFRIRVRIRNQNGTFVNDAGTTIDWNTASLPTWVGITPLNSDNNPVIIEIPANSVSVPTPVTVTASAGTSAAAELHLRVYPAGFYETDCGEADQKSDHIWAAHTDKVVPEAVILDAAAGGAAVDDLTLLQAGLACLSENLEESGSADPAEVAIFSEDKGTLWESVEKTGLTDPWTGNLGDRLKRVDELQARLKVSVKIRIRVTPEEAETGPLAGLDEQERREKVLGAVGWDLGVTEEMFRANRVGIQFDTVPYSTVFGTGNLIFPTPTVNCKEKDYLQTTFDIDLDQEILYIAYVSSIGGGYHGYSCLPQPGWKGSLVVVTALDRYGTTLAHELGHQFLGSTAPNHGHTSNLGVPLEGFHNFNLMKDYVDLDEGTHRDHLTLGQVFRMNVDESSWMNFNGTRAGATRACPTKCLDLTHDVYQLVVVLP